MLLFPEAIRDMWRTLPKHEMSGVLERQSPMHSPKKKKLVLSQGERESMLASLSKEVVFSIFV